MGSNKTEEYDAYIKMDEEFSILDCKWPELKELIKVENFKEETVTPDFVIENTTKVDIPNNISTKVFKSKIWDEYSERCIGCGRCNFVCPTCTCFTMQDIFYRDNGKLG